jgi:uncharacterized lipoprotein YmbA
MRMIRRAACIAAAALLSACASAPPDRFYTLGGSAPAAAAVPPAQTVYIELLAVTVPAQVRRKQLVVATGPGQVDMLEHHRWIGPLADEIQQALSLEVSTRLGAIDVDKTPYPDGAAPWRISTNVQRFESVPGAYALLDATWSVRRVGSEAVLTCRSVLREPVGQGYEALVAGHKAALARLAEAMAAAVRKGAPAGSC